MPQEHLRKDTHQDLLLGVCRLVGRELLSGLISGLRSSRRGSVCASRTLRTWHHRWHALARCCSSRPLSVPDRHGHPPPLALLATIIRRGLHEDCIHFGRLCHLVSWPCSTNSTQEHWSSRCCLIGYQPAAHRGTGPLQSAWARREPHIQSWWRRALPVAGLVMQHLACNSLLAHQLCGAPSIFLSQMSAMQGQTVRNLVRLWGKLRHTHLLVLPHSRGAFCSSFFSHVTNSTCDRHSLPPLSGTGVQIAQDRWTSSS